jgi:hypothetical protein
MEVFSYIKNESTERNIYWVGRTEKYEKGHVIWNQPVKMQSCELHLMR